MSSESLNSATFIKGTVTEAQKEAVRNIVTDIISRNFSFARKQINANLDELKNSVKDEIFVYLELLLSGNISIFVKGDVDE